MNFKNAINYKELKAFFESKGFSVTSQSGDLIFTSPRGYCFAISQPWKDSNMVYLDCYLLYQFGFSDAPREWPDGTNLYDYLVNIFYPFVRNLGGYKTLAENPESVIDSIKKILAEKGVDYEYFDTANITYIECHPRRRLFNKTIKYKLFSFYKGNVKYGLILAQFNSIFLARFRDDSNTVFYEYPWYSFCPAYKGGKDYIKTTIDNFLDFIEQDCKLD